MRSYGPKKTQVELVQLLQEQGWIEEQYTKDIRRWREPKTKALYSLRDAVSLVRSRKKKAS